MSAILISTVLLSASLLVAYPAAGSLGLAPGPHQGPRTLRVGVSGLTAVTLNPNAITLSLEFIPVYNVYSTLVTRDASLRIAPDLAYRWEVAPDEVTWTFHIVPNAYFTDPTNPTDLSHAVTADDVVFSYYLVKNHTGSILNSYTSQLDRIEKVDQYTVRIVTKSPFAAMDSTLTAIPIFPKYLWESIQNPVTQEPFPYPIGSGAMYYDPNSDLSGGPIILHRNPSYFGDARYCQVSRPDEVRFLLYTNSGIMIGDFGTGQNRLDAIFNIPASSFLNADDLKQSTVTRIQVSGGFVGEVAANVMTDELRAALVASGLTQFRTGKNSQILATNLVVRQAIAMSIDRAAIVRYAYQGLATIGDSLIPASNPWHYDVPAEQEYAFDPGAARAMLNDAGWAYDAAGNAAGPTTTPLYKAGGMEKLTFRFYTPDNHPEFEPAVANITAWLRQAGIETTDERSNTVPGYELKPVNQMNSIWKALDYDIWLWDWIFSRVSDPSLDILQVQTTEAIGPTSDNGYSDAAYDALYNESLVTVDPVARRALTDQMQQMLYDYASYIIPYYADDLYAVMNDPAKGNGWQNWGDWTTHPGLTIDSALPVLYFDLVPGDNPPPVITSFSAIDYVAGSETTVSVIASDPNDASLTYTWDFGDGTAPATTPTNSVPHTFPQPGTYSVTVRVEDAEWPVCATTTATISPGAANLPPVVTLDIQFPAGVTHGWENESLTLSVVVRDPEGDPIYIAWDFGDGTNAVDYATSTSTDRTITRAHTYAAGNYSLVVSVTDNQTGAGHLQTKTATVPVWTTPTGGGPPPAGLGLDPLVNYGVPLGIVAVILIAAAVVLMRRRRARKEEEREGEPPRQPPPPPPS